MGTTSPSPTLLTGDHKDWLPQSRTKDPVDHAIPSVPLVPLKVNGRRPEEVSPTCPNNNMSTAPDVTATTDAEEVGTNPAGDTPRMPAVTRVRTATVIPPDKDDADSTEDRLLQPSADTTIPEQEVRTT